MEYTDALEYLKILRNLVDITEHDSGAELQRQTYDVAIEALEKQIPKKVNKEILTSNAFTQWRKYTCPNCGCFIYSGTSLPYYPQTYCHKCGQVINWEGVEDNE